MALTANRNLNLKMRTNPVADIVELPVAAATHIFNHSLVGVNAAGYAVPFAAPTVGTTVVGGHRLIGLADHESDNTLGAAGAKRIKVLLGAAVDHAVASAAITDVGKPVFASDDGTLTKVAAGNTHAGWIENFVSTGIVTVRLLNPFGIVAQLQRVSASIPCEAANVVKLIHETENHNGLIIEHAFALVTEQFAGGSQDQGIITLQDTDGTTLGITFTPSDAGADAVGDVVAPAANSVAIGGATGSALVIVPAGKGVQAKVTQLTSGAGAAGEMKVAVKASPIA